MGFHNASGVASAISFAPTGSVAATDVQAAIAEVAADAAALVGTGGDIETYTGPLPSDKPAGTILVKSDGTGLAFVPGPFAGTILEQTTAPTSGDAVANSIYLVGPLGSPTSLYLVPKAG